MSNKQILINEIETLPADFIDEVFRFVSFIKKYKSKTEMSDITLLSEQSLAKEWLLPEEDIAWQDL